MIGLLDPALLLPRSEEELQEELAHVVRACRQYNIRLVEFGEYWPKLWRFLGKNLELSISPKARRAVQAVRRLGQSAALQQRGSLTVWRRGFRQLFNAAVLGEDWEAVMASAVAAAFSIDEDVVVFTRRILNRNVLRHTADHATLDENTRWVLHVSAHGIGPRHIRCVYHVRNLAERWTARYDWRLPAEGDGARYPFCPRAEWWKPSTTVFGTVQGKPSWLDAHENGWARPNIPGGAGYHWDVFIRSAAQQQRIGVAHVNVVEFGVSKDEGRCGDLHHIPRGQHGRITDAGWIC